MLAIVKSWGKEKCKCLKLSDECKISMLVVASCWIKLLHYLKCCLLLEFSSGLNLFKVWWLLCWFWKLILQQLKIFIEFDDEKGEMEIDYHDNNIKIGKLKRVIHWRVAVINQKMNYDLSGIHEWKMDKKKFDDKILANLFFNFYKQDFGPRIKRKENFKFSIQILPNIKTHTNHFHLCPILLVTFTHFFYVK